MARDVYFGGFPSPVQSLHMESGPEFKAIQVAPVGWLNTVRLSCLHIL